MKSIILAFLSVALTLTCIDRPVYAASVPGIVQPTHYVVIGAFSIKGNAERFTAAASKYNAHFDINPNRNLFYVYVLTTDNVKDAIAEARKLRKESPYFDTWVYYGILGSTAEAMAEPGKDIHPDTSEDFQPENLDTKSAIAELGVDTTTRVAQAPAEMPDTDTEITNKAYYFKLFRADNEAPLQGDVDMVDVDRSRKVASYTGNTTVSVKNPGSKSGKVVFVCEVFGYRKQQAEVIYTNPQGEGITVGDEQQVIIPFAMSRLQKGDIAVMYNVYFFNDAAIMRPESRFEVNSLLQMLQENPKYKIKIHGHTNGGAPGKIISMDKDSKDFFSLNNTREGFGTAKKLSQERAEVIRDFLVSNGVDPKRMQVKAWGGKRPLVDKLATKAQSNVRVEIEILEN